MKRAKLHRVSVLNLLWVFAIFLSSIPAFGRDNADSLKKADTANITAKTVADSDKVNVSNEQTDKRILASNQIKVMDVYKLGADKEDRNRAGIGDIIVVRVQNLKYLLDQASCSDSLGRAMGDNCHKREIRLFIDGRMIKDIAPESGAPQEDKGELQFHLMRNPNNDEAWADILGAPVIGRGFTKRAVRISVGLENDYPVPTDVNKFILNRVRRAWFIFSALLLGLYYVALYFMATRSGLLRDRGIDVSALGLPARIGLAPYSLGRLQLAFWFSLVVTSFLFIWLVTGAYDMITGSILGLIGISAGTSLSGLVIDNSKGEELLTQTLALKAEQRELSDRIPALEKEANEIVDDPTKKAELGSELSTKRARLAALPSLISKNEGLLKPKSSKGFGTDVFEDVNGMSFHRLQMFVWTIVLGLLFIYSVWARLAMPEFSATLLALQGLTAGTYLGFKIPEKNP